MTDHPDDLYYKGYIAGYYDGIAAAKQGIITENTKDVSYLPIQAMAISSRAKNCLMHSGCIYIKDVSSLSEHAIASMRGLGTKTASEIACWLDDHGIRYSAWHKYL